MILTPVTAAGGAVRSKPSGRLSRCPRLRRRKRGDRRASRRRRALSAGRPCARHPVGSGESSLAGPLHRRGPTLRVRVTHPTSACDIGDYGGETCGQVHIGRPGADCALDTHTESSRYRAGARCSRRRVPHLPIGCVRFVLRARPHPPGLSMRRAVRRWCMRVKRSDPSRWRSPSPRSAASSPWLGPEVHPTFLM